MPTGEMPNPHEIVGFQYEGEEFCRDCYGGKDRTKPIVYSIAWMNKKIVCTVCKKQLWEVTK